MTEKKRVYTDDEVNAILSRAIDRQRVGSPEGLTHEELLAVARDAGIAPDAVEAAAVEIAERRETDLDREDVLRRLRSGFRGHFFTYLFVMAFLVMVNGMTTSYPWAVWPALAWGLALALHMRVALFPSDVEIARRVERSEARRRRAEERRRRREAKSAMREGARELGHAVERGVATILSATAKAIHEEVDRTGREPPPRVRVDEDARERRRVGDDRDPARERREEEDDADDRGRRRSRR
jgi:hypothetical protein